LNPPASPTPNAPLKFGILGAANISPYALISPALNHPETVVYAVAARDNKKAIAFGKKHDIAKVYSGPTGYQREDPLYSGKFGNKIYKDYPRIIGRPRSGCRIQSREFY
jgi:hypothetical protein